MLREALTLEQIQRKVLEATKECPCTLGKLVYYAIEDSFVASNMGICAPCHAFGLHQDACVGCYEYDPSGKGTGRVPLFPKAGESCPCRKTTKVDHYKRWGVAQCWNGLVPTQDVGRLLEAFHDYLAKDYLGYETIWGFSRLWQDASGQHWAFGWGHDPDMNKIDDFVWGETQPEVLWRAMDTVLEAQNA